jgi:ribonuclease T
LKEEQQPKKTNKIKKRFDGFLPVVIDLETGGCNPLKHPILEIAAINVICDEQGLLIPTEKFACHVTPYEGSKLDEAALQINKIDPYHPFRFAIDETEALNKLFEYIRQCVKDTGCRRAVLVGHNAHFDLSFIQNAVLRCKIKDNPLHSFTCFDTATLGGVMYGKTVLAKALRKAGISFDKNEAHSAIYDTEKTTELFCKIVNQFHIKN